MFDFAWSEIALIGAVALIAIGPKDMPAAIRTVSGMIKKARRMAAEFQTHVDEMVREANIGDVKKAFSDIRNLDIPSLVEKHVDPDRSIRSTFGEDPFKTPYPAASPDAAEISTIDQPAVEAPPVEEALAEPLAAPGIIAEPQQPMAPAFIPPGLVPPSVVHVPAEPAEAPAFIPPEAVLQRRSKV
jgi:sec-independent protein translocase protein TatB